MLRSALASICAVSVMACGCGGGGEAPTVETAAGIDGCSPRVVSVLLVGDSTLYGYDGATSLRAAEPPDVVLQQQLDARFGGGAAEVRSIAQNGAASNGVTPADVVGDVTVVNFGINDAAAMTAEQYKAQLRQLRPTLFQTPNPTFHAIRPADGTLAFAEAMREVATETGTPVADVMAYVSARPDWKAELPDGAHPTNALYRAIVTDVLAPAVAEQVAALRCETVAAAR